MIYIAADTETTGLDPYEHEVLSASFIVDDFSKTSNLVDFNELPVLEVVIDPDKNGFSGQLEALVMNADLLRLIKELRKQEHPEYEYYIYKKEKKKVKYFADYEFAERIMEKFFTEYANNKVVFCGKNFDTFDLKFLNSNLDISKIVDHSWVSWDPGTVFSTVEDTKIPNLGTCLQRAGLGEKTNAHTAFGDAYDVWRLLRYHFFGEKWSNDFKKMGGVK